jgi:parallel beta-helix repeat protein
MNGVEGNVYWLYGERNYITDTTSSWAGSTISGTLDNTACGFFLENVDDTTIQNVIGHDNYANGVTFETHYQLSYPGENFSKNWKIADSTFYNNFAGVYCEKAKDGLIINCISHHNNNQESYGDMNASGFILGQYSHNITIEGCLSHHNGDLSGGGSARGYGYSITSTSTIGGNCSIIDCKSYSNVWHCYNFNIPADDGINIYGDNSYHWSGCVSNNIVDGAGDISISIGVIENIIISNNAITNSVDDGIYITGGTGEPYMGNNTVMGNNIQSSDMGIYLINTNDTIVTDNRVLGNRGCVEAGSSNYTLLDNNNFRGCTNVHTVDATGSKVGTNILFNGSSNFNHFGDTTNYVDVNETGYMTFHGDARVERHADINAGTWIKHGLADPGTSTEGLFCTLDFDKATNETVYYTFHIPWRRCENTDIEVQVKWFHDTNASDANKKVMWGFDYVSIETGETVDAVNTSITQLSAGNHNTDAGKLVSTTFTTKIVAGNLANHDTMGLRFYRVGTATGDDLNEDARLISVHLHFTMDKLGEPIG